jgi:hypothetical protein
VPIAATALPPSNESKPVAEKENKSKDLDWKSTLKEFDLKEQAEIEGQLISNS